MRHALLKIVRSANNLADESKFSGRSYIKKSSGPNIDP